MIWLLLAAGGLLLLARRGGGPPQPNSSPPHRWRMPALVLKFASTAATRRDRRLARIAYAQQNPGQPGWLAQTSGPARLYARTLRGQRPQFKDQCDPLSNDPEVLRHGGRGGFEAVYEPRTEMTLRLHVPYLYAAEILAAMRRWVADEAEDVYQTSVLNFYRRAPHADIPYADRVRTDSPAIQYDRMDYVLNRPSGVTLESCGQMPRRGASTLDLWTNFDLNVYETAQLLGWMRAGQAILDEKNQWGVLKAHERAATGDLFVSILAAGIEAVADVVTGGAFSAAMAGVNLLTGNFLGVMEHAAAVVAGPILQEFSVAVREAAHTALAGVTSLVAEVPEIVEDIDYVIGIAQRVYAETMDVVAKVEHVYGILTDTYTYAMNLYATGVQIATLPGRALDAVSRSLDELRGTADRVEAAALGHLAAAKQRAIDARLADFLARQRA